MPYQILIDGENRESDVVANTLTIIDVINDKANTCSFFIMDVSGLGLPELTEEVVIRDSNNNLVFGGHIVKVTMDSIKKTGEVGARVDCIDYTWELDRNLVHKTYMDMTDKEIIEAIVATYCSGLGITTANVIEGVNIDQISFNYIQPSQALRQICDLTGRNWYIDYEKDIHYFPLATEAAPFEITVDNDQYMDLKIQKDASQIKNRVYVRGGTKLSDFTTYAESGDGEKTVFVLPDKPHDISVEVNGTPKTVGIKHIDTAGFDWYVNFQEKYVEQDSSGSVLTTSDTLEVTYKYDIPILVAIENTASILEYGQKEFAIFDKQITTTQAARDRASAELTDYANNIVEGTYSAYGSGLRSGQVVNITLPEYGLADDYIIQQVTMRSFGAGNFRYDVKIASAKTLGIIRFLIEMLEANKNLIELDDSEAVDELFNITDSLISDSILDSLIIDSQGAYFTWVEDSPAGTIKTRARYDLYQWG